jgi:hypothetical protein
MPTTVLQNNGDFPLSLFPFSLLLRLSLSLSNSVTFLLSHLSVVFTCPIPNIRTGRSASKHCTDQCNSIWPQAGHLGYLTELFPATSLPSQSLQSSHYVMSPELKAEIVFGLLATLIGVLAIYISIRQYYVSTRPRRESQFWKSRSERQLEWLCADH